MTVDVFFSENLKKALCHTRRLNLFLIIAIVVDTRSDARCSPLPAITSTPLPVAIYMRAVLTGIIAKQACRNAWRLRRSLELEREWCISMAPRPWQPCLHTRHNNSDQSWVFWTCRRVHFMPSRLWHGLYYKKIDRLKTIFRCIL